MSLKTVLLTRMSRPSGALAAWRLLQSNHELSAVIVERRSQMVKKKKSGVFDLIRQHGFHFLFGRLIEALEIKRHYFLRKKLRGHYNNPIYLSIEELALDYPFKLHIVDSHNSSEVQALLREIKPDIGVLTNTRKIKPEVLNIPRHGFLNMHLSLLPKYAGLDAIFWMLYHGEKNAGATVHFAAPEIDQGHIVEQRQIPICILDNEETLYQKMLWLGTSLIIKALDKIDAGTFEPQVQDTTQGSYFSWPTRKQRAELRHRLQRRKTEPASEKNVLHIITRMTRGGAQENTRATLQGLRRAGYEPVLITGASWSAEGEILSQALEEGLEIIILPELIRELNWRRDLMAFFKLYRFLGRQKFMIVHTHMSKAGLLGRWAAWLRRVPYIVHTPHGHVFHSYFSPVKEKLFLWLERRTARITNCLIALTDICLKEHLELKVGRDEQWSVIPSGVNPESFKVLNSSIVRKRREELDIPSGAFVIGFVGRLEPIKGPVFLIEAAPAILAAVSKAHFLFVGDGSLKSGLEERVQSLDIQQHVTFLGDRQDVSAWMSLMDVVVVPSLNEGMGRVIVESGLLHRPVVASNVGGIPNLIRHNRTGFMAEPKNIDQIAESVTRILKDSLLAARLGENLYELVSKEFTEDRMVEKMIKLYQSLTHRV
ncbi:MAG: glycosyltransferase [Candidatus Omnitrophica bacterium]|nr:glycosyltransferase [Candidatus Omnitrophota bacterium]